MIYKIVADERLLLALIAADRIGHFEAVDHKRLEEEASDVIAQWIQKWID